MRLTRTHLALVGAGTALAAAIGVTLGSPDKFSSSQSQTAAPIRFISPEEMQREAEAKEKTESDAKLIALAKKYYGVHFNHPANKGVVDPAKFLPRTNVWAEIQFQGQDGHKFLKPIVKTYGDVKVSIPNRPRKITQPSADRPGTFNTIFVWDMTVTFGRNATYYETMYNSNVADPADRSLVRGWSAFVDDNEGRPIRKKAVEAVVAYLTDHVILTGTDPTQPRNGAMEGLPISWDDLAAIGQHLPYHV